MKKYLIIAVVVVASIASSVSAATGTTLTCQTGLPCGGGPTQAYNFTTKKLDMVPQCFPWTWLTSFKTGSIFDIYRNQDACRAQRKIDFGM